MLRKKCIWSPFQLLDIFTSVVCSHPVCYVSMSNTITVFGLDRRIPLLSSLDISNVARTIEIGLDVGQFSQLVTSSIPPSIISLKRSIASESNAFWFPAGVYSSIVGYFLIPRIPNFNHLSSSIEPCFLFFCPHLI